MCRPTNIQDQTEVTPEIIEAGVEDLRESGRLAYEMGDVDSVLVDRIIRAALREKPSNRSGQSRF